MVDEDVIVAQFKMLSRGLDGDFLSFLPPFEEAVMLAGTSTLVRMHFLAHDINGVPVVESLAAAMAKAVVDFCIPRDKILQAYGEFQKTGSTAPLVSLSEQARDLFVKSEKSGEGGELLLFILSERVLGRPQLISKMALKTNTQVHVQGSDGIHADLAEDGVLDLYWGESKLYQSSSQAFRDCFESIAPYLRADGFDRRKQDLFLVRQNMCMDSADLIAYLLEYFDESNSKSMCVRWNGVCLVGFDYKDYPNIDLLCDSEIVDLRRKIEQWHVAIKQRLEQFEILEANVDLYCIPMPSVDVLRARVLSRMGVK